MTDLQAKLDSARRTLMGCRDWEELRDACIEVLDAVECAERDIERIDSRINAVVARTSSNN
jgi:hypothetical protein